MGMNKYENVEHQAVHKDFDSGPPLTHSFVPKILIIGIGGAGNNCIHQLHLKEISRVTTIAINTDNQQLEMSNADYKVLIGTKLTGGMGVGGNPELGRKCALASRDVIEKLFEDAELIFLIAGMGGGTGTGATPIIADLARTKGAVVIGIVTTPFRFERGRKRRARQGLRILSAAVHSLLVVDNDKLLGLAPELPLDSAFRQIDDLIAEIISGLAETMTIPSLINLDIADIKTIMQTGKLALMYYGESDTLDPDEIVRNTFENPLLNIEHSQASGALIHITGGSQLSLKLTTEITNSITKRLKPNSNVILGARINPDFTKEVKLLTIMTGIRPLSSGMQYLDLNHNSSSFNSVRI